MPKTWTNTDIRRYEVKQSIEFLHHKTKIMLRNLENNFDPLDTDGLDLATKFANVLQDIGRLQQAKIDDKQ